jgi:hypothetical protein
MTANPQEDFAIVAGITDYASLCTLTGPENDAQQFYDWVTTTGKVAPSRAQYLSSSTYPGHNGRRDKPDHALIDDAFRTLLKLSRAQRAYGSNPKIGRRLYVFLAGHGFAPGYDLTSRVLALLTADYDEEDLTDGHVAAPLYQKHVGASGAFDEILLFMDCCGTNAYRPGARNPFAPPVLPKHKPRLFFAAAAEPGKITREATRTRGTRARGVFSLALEDALSGKAAHNSRITNVTLAAYLSRHMRTLVDPLDLDDDEVSKEPYIESYPPLVEFDLFNNVPLALSRVTFNVDAGLVGLNYEISDGSVLLWKGVTGASFQRAFETGTFKLTVGGGLEISFDVTGDMHVAVG